jgi:hypothetical protein
MKLTQRSLDHIQELLNFKNQFGPTATPEQQAESYQRYLAWLATPAGTHAILTRNWQAQVTPDTKEVK